MTRLFAEFVGTFTLVFFALGVAAVAIMQPDPGMWLVCFTLVGGLTVIWLAHLIGHVSGCHLNPIVSLGAFLAGQLRGGAILGYWVAQIAGAVMATRLIVELPRGSVGMMDMALLFAGIAGLGLATTWLMGRNAQGRWFFA